jgi:hypothetical protein
MLGTTLDFIAQRRILIIRGFAIVVAVYFAAAPVKAAPILNPGNGHYYDYISTQVDFATAVASAASMTYLGLQGYLVTVTDADEQAFLDAANNGTQRYWMGGSDAAVEGEWRWVTGPEAGQLFWLGGPGGTAIGYANWFAGEPNDAGDNEDGLLGREPGLGWNDLPLSVSRPFVVEYSAVGAPEPASLTLLGAGIVALLVRARDRHTSRKPRNHETAP